MSGFFYAAGSYPIHGSASSSILDKAELAMIQAGFDLLPTPTGFPNAIQTANAGGTAFALSIATLTSAGVMAGLTGLTSTGTVDLTGATATAATQAAGDSSTKLATTGFVQTAAFAAALPAQTSNAGKIVTTNGTTASWGIPQIPTAAAGGTVDAITATFSPVLTLTDQMTCAVVCAGANTSTTPTFAPNGLTAHTITTNGGKALAVGSIGAAGFVAILEYNLANTRWELLNPVPSAGISAVAAITASTTLTSTSAGYQQTQMTAIGQSVTMPDATTLSVGTPRYYIDNSKGGYPVGIRDNAGTLLMGVAAGGTAFVSLESASTAAGVWSVTGTNLEPGLITIDNTFSATYTAVFKQFAALDANKSIHFVQLASGFAAVAVDYTTGAVGTPVTVTATASMVPRIAYKISSTTAVVFYGANTNTLTGVVLSLTAPTTLAIGTPSSTLSATNCGKEDFTGAPLIAQLDTNLFLVSYATATGAGTTSVAAFQVSGGTTITLGTAADILVASNVGASTSTYALTTTTALVLYKSGTAPMPNNGVVISVTNANPPVCTIGTPAALTGVASSGTTPPASCKLSATKVLVLDDNNSAGSIIVSAFTISAGTTVTAGTAVSVETGITDSTDYTAESATRWNAHLSPCTSTTALLWYVSSTPFTSRTVVISESAGTVSAGTIVYGAWCNGTITAAGFGQILPQGTTEFAAVQSSLASTAGYGTKLVVSKINGTAITQGSMLPLPAPMNTTATSIFATRTTTGKYVVHGSSTGTVNQGLSVFSSNGDCIAPLGVIRCAASGWDGAYQRLASSNRLILTGVQNGFAAGGQPIRLISVEIAA